MIRSWPLFSFTSFSHPLIRRTPEDAILFPPVFFWLLLIFTKNTDFLGRPGKPGPTLVPGV